jgi:hypothetical protein
MSNAAVLQAATPRRLLCFASPPIGGPDRSIEYHGAYFSAQQPKHRARPLGGKSRDAPSCAPQAQADREEITVGIEIGGLFGLLLLIADVYAIVKTVQSSASTGSKVIWIVVILLLPLVGLIAWFLFGPKE